MTVHAHSRKRAATHASPRTNADSVRNLLGDYAYPAHIETQMETSKTNVINQPMPDRNEAADDYITAISNL